jgi:hypothetical protein
MEKKACYYCGSRTTDYGTRIEYDGQEHVTCQKCLNTCFWIEHDDRPDSYYVPLTCDHCGAELGAFIDPAESSIGEVYCWDCLNFNFQGWDADLSHLRNKR